eukprot:scaffold5480_cov111-Isochrysis_galbana.AAC.1
MGCAKASISGSTSGISRLRRRWSRWNSPRDGRSAMLALDGTHWSHASTWRASRISAKAWTMLMESGAPE